MAKLHFITGGQRSGKSSYAQQLVEAATEEPIYLATAKIGDEDFRDRVKRHQEARGEQWTTLEIPVKISEAELSGKVVLMDCVTLWLSNLFFDHQDESIDAILDLAKAEFNRLLAKDCELYVISNEIGMGGHAEHALARRFADLQGWMNQYIAQRADTVTLMVSGMPLTLKQ